MNSTNWYEYVIQRLNDIDARLKHVEEKLDLIDRRPIREESPWAPDWNPPPQPGA